MRKFYPLIAGLLFCLVVMKTPGQQKLISSAFSESYSLNTNAYFTNETSAEAGISILTEPEKTKYSITDSTCQADFEINLTPNSFFTKKFTAIPLHSEQKKPVYICWSFGDGKDTCIQYTNTFTGPYPVVHTYQNPGQYEVCVRMVYEGGCEAKICKPVVLPKPDECKADFEKLSFVSANYPLLAYFKALPGHNNNKKPKQICWKFGDGKDTCIDYPENFTGQYGISHIYSDTGKYEVCVKIIYYGGCEAKNCKLIDIPKSDECKANFERLPLLSVNHPLLAYFKALPGHNNNKKPKQICWTFGDGKDTCINYPENFTGTYAVKHEYTGPGNYEVCVKIFYYGGCEAKICKSVQIGSRPDECKADIEKLQLTTDINPLVVYYKALPGHNNNKKPKQICWKFGDGKDTCIDYPENFTGAYAIRHEYREQGNYEVCVKIIYYGGCEAKLCKSITAGHPAECKAGFERLPSATASNSSLQTVFNALPWHSNNKKPKRICWTFGDGKDTCIEYNENYAGTYLVQHRYNQAGNYEVCIKILYYGGCEAKKCETVKIEGAGECRVKLSVVSESITSLTRGFSIQPWSSNNKKPLALCLNFGDGRDTCIQFNPTLPWPELNIRHAYPAPGVYRACVKVMFDGGCYAYECIEVPLKPSTNICGGYMTDSLLSPRTVRFKGFAVQDQNIPSGDYKWTFGDGSTSAGKEVTHTYNAPGSYEVCLTIKTPFGCETKICKKLVVHGEIRPVLQISPNPVANVMHVLFYSTHTEPVNIKIVNAYGVVVKSFVRNAATGANNWDFDLSMLMAGFYTLYVKSTNQLSSQLFIKN